MSVLGRIDELLSTDLRYKKRVDQGNYIEYVFWIKDRKFLIFFSKGSQYGSKESWGMAFHDEDGKLELTGKGDSIRVFSAVIEIVKSFVEEKKPVEFVFSCSSGRTKFYERLARYIEKNSDYKRIVNVDQPNVFRFKEY